ncbi:uncharacterized protein LOC116027728 isoform X2 [Ipomoea triloba]|uniref:uncharacterized protein LOC116027728 isoform X2 n=1 Tax=Ipomoea triloba TaxID=35885 RepID=UPI00125E3DE8|nr:uncharacterized protein LOC116027728 isoform X2 [Ipomoea triloba]
MASSTPDLSRLKPNHASNPSRKVRIVGKIRGFTDQELGFLSNSKPWITVNKSSDEDASGKVTISFGDKGTRKLFSGGKVTASKQTKVPSDDSLATKSSKILQDTSSIVASSSLHEKTEVPPNDSVVTKSGLLQDDTIFTITSSMHEEEAEVPSEPFQTDSISMIKRLKTSLHEENFPQGMEITSGNHGEAIGFTSGEGFYSIGHKIARGKPITSP